MLKLITAAIALAFATSYAAAQTSAPTGATQQNAPNSGAGIPGYHGLAPVRSPAASVTDSPCKPRSRLAFWVKDGK